MSRCHASLGETWGKPQKTYGVLVIKPGASDPLGSIKPRGKKEGIRHGDWTRETASKEVWEEKRRKIFISCRERLCHVSFYPVTVPQIKPSCYSMLVCDPVVSKYSHDVTCDGPGFPSGSGTGMSSGEWTGHVCPSQCMGTPQLSGSRDRRPLVGRPQGES